MLPGVCNVNYRSFIQPAHVRNMYTVPKSFQSELTHFHLHHEISVIEVESRVGIQVAVFNFVEMEQHRRIALERSQDKPNPTSTQFEVLGTWIATHGSHPSIALKLPFPY